MALQGVTSLEMNNFVFRFFIVILQVIHNSCMFRFKVVFSDKAYLCICNGVYFPIFIFSRQFIKWQIVLVFIMCSERKLLNKKFVVSDKCGARNLIFSSI